MAERRMFAKTIIDSDAFLDMPLSTQALYFHLSMRADDDGFLNNANRIMRTIGANNNDFDLLLAKKFIIRFDGGICVIKHWRIHNYIQADRYSETNYKKEKSMLCLDENKAYTLENTNKKLVGNKIVETNLITNNPCIHDVYKVDTQVRLGKDSIGKDSIGNNSASNNASSTKVPHSFYKSVIDYLNLKANKSFKFTTKETQKIIKARYREGYSLEDFKKVIDNKCREWLNNPTMDMYLRPKTLFGTKFESYLNEKNINVPKENKNYGGFNNFEPRQKSKRYSYLEEQCLLGTASEEEQEEFSKMRGGL